MGFAPNVFVSSSCYELRDLRAAVRRWLSDMGFNPILSDADGFPHKDGMPPGDLDYAVRGKFMQDVFRDMFGKVKSYKWGDAEFEAMVAGGRATFLFDEHVCSSKTTRRFPSRGGFRPPGARNARGS